MDGLPVDPYASELSQSDIEQRKASWTNEDYVAFAEWQQSEAFKAWMQKSYDEIMEEIRNMKTTFPDNLRDIFESDD